MKSGHKRKDENSVSRLFYMYNHLGSRKLTHVTIFNSISI